MKLYNVTIVQHKTMMIENIEAETEEQARELAEEQAWNHPDLEQCEPCFETEDVELSSDND